jgi:hypothetical protein
MRKVKRDKFDVNVTIVGPCTTDWRIEEPAWIAYGRAEGWKLTNMTDGGDGKPGCIITEKTRKKMSDNHADVSGKNNPMFGVIRSGKDNPLNGIPRKEETKNKISKTLTGRIPTQEACNNISIAVKNSDKCIKHLEQLHINQIGKPSGMKGKTAWNKGLKVGSTEKQHITYQSAKFKEKQSIARTIWWKNKHKQDKINLIYLLYNWYVVTLLSSERPTMTEGAKLNG